MRKSLFILIIVLLILNACQPTTVFSEFHTTSLQGWHQDSVLTYEAQTDSAKNYDILIVLRHTSQYPYQNIWLFVNTYDGVNLLQRDTIEANVADDYGRWLGSGINHYELPLLYLKNYQTLTTKPSFTIQQGMRTEWLKGITNVGLVIQEHNEQK